MSDIEKYQQVFIDVFGVEKTKLDDQFTFKEYPAWDSVAHLSLITALEDEFDVMFEAEDILHYESYINGITILKKYGIKFD